MTTPTPLLAALLATARRTGVDPATALRIVRQAIEKTMEERNACLR